MSTFLQLCQRVREEAGISGTGPTAVTNQTGEYKRVVNWVASAWNDIQITDPNWRWMTGQFSFALTPAQATYTSAEAGITTRFDHWMPKSIRMGLTPPNDERMLEPISYDLYRATYLTGPNPLSRPVVVSVTPDQKLAFGYQPNAAYIVTGEYKKSPQTLSADSDVPEMPAQFHEAIVYRALMMYGRYENAMEVFQDAQMNYNRLMTLLRNHQMPYVTDAEPMA